MTQSGNEAGACGEADDGDEDVEADGVHEPDGGVRDAAEGGVDGAEPSGDDSGDERSACCGESERDPAELEDDGSDDRADGDGESDEGDVGDVGGAIDDAESLGGDVDVLRAAHERDGVAALECSFGEHGDLGFGGTATDGANVDSARFLKVCQLCESFAVDVFAGDEDVNACDLGGYGE